MRLCELFSRSPLPRFYTSSYIVIIPKVKDPKIFDKFRLISLCLVAYKSCSKLLVKRMTSILHLMVSPEQGTLILKLSIFKNNTLAQDLVQLLNHKSQGRNVVIKIDMFKAYDRVN